jgi:acetyltransferase-like isoleucine patch superfamily enzyme
MPEIMIRILFSITNAALRLEGAVSKIAAYAQFSRAGAVGKNCNLEGRGQLIDGDQLQVGDEVSIGRNFFIRAKAGVSIGSYTHISRNVTIHSVNHNTSGVLLPYDKSEVLRPVSIGRFVWIGMNSSILPGVTIGDGAIIGMATVVSRDVPAGAVLVGAPSRLVKFRESTHTEKLVERNQFYVHSKRRYISRLLSRAITKS